MTKTLWLLIFVFTDGQIEIDGPFRADVCQERITFMEEVSMQTWGKPYGAQCVHVEQPWRRLLPSGPNQHELKARKLELLTK